MKSLTIPLARFAIFIIYFWFGLLKVIGESPATPLVEALFQNTIGKFVSFIGFSEFMIAFGLFEMIIGVLFIIPKLEKLAVYILVVHLVTTTMPILILPAFVWTKSLVPTLEGQYIIKNIAILALAINILVHTRSKQQYVQES